MVTILVLFSFCFSFVPLLAFFTDIVQGTSGVKENLNKREPVHTFITESEDAFLGIFNFLGQLEVGNWLRSSRKFAMSVFADEQGSTLC